MPDQVGHDAGSSVAAVQAVEQSMGIAWTQAVPTDERLKAALVDLPIAIGWFDLAGRLLFGNREFTRVVGMNDADLAGRTRADFLPPDDAAAQRATDLRVLATGQPMPFRESTHRPEGIRTYVSVKFPLDDGNGNPYGICVIATDTTDLDLEQAERERLASIGDASDDAIVVLDADLRITSWNRGAEVVYGYEAEEVLGRSSDILIPADATADSRGLRNHMLAGGEVQRFETQRLHKDGTLIDVAITAFALTGPDGNPTGATTITRDITRRTRAERALAESDERYREILDSTPDGVWRFDADGRTDYVNARMASMLGYSPEEMLGRGLPEFMDPDQLELAQTVIADARESGRVAVVENWFERKDGTRLWGRVSHTTLTDLLGTNTGAMAIISDVTMAKANEAELRSSESFVAAIADSMVEGLYAIDDKGALTYMNRAAERLLGWTEGELRGHSMHQAVHFRHPDGSARPVEECALTSVVTTGEPVTIDSDTFIRRDGAMLPVAYTSSPLELGGVMGAVVVFRDNTEGSAKARQLAHEIESVTWVGRVRDALDEQRLVLYAQPIMELSSRKVTQYELLLRMIDRNGQLIAPNEFLPTAERYGLIEEIDQWVIDQAARLVGEEKSGRVHFNLSGKSMARADLAATIQSALRVHGGNAGDLICEITETALIQHAQLAERFVRELTALGCKVALDDFGTGYGGFSYLKRLPVAYLKIDIEFVRDLADNRASRHVVAAIVNLAHGLGQRTIAEGVEDEARLQLLEDMGVDYAQGFAIARPAPVAQIFRPGADRAATQGARP